jgi:Mce-associated membrane protein
VSVPAPPQHAPAEIVAQPPRRLVGVATLVGLVAALVLALGLAAWFRGEANQLTGSAAASNAALVDAGATAAVSDQVRHAVQRVFSYDFTRLDEDERAASQVVTGAYAEAFRQQFARVRAMAPGQRAVVVATVPALAVKTLDGDRAVLLVFVDQQARQGGQDQPLVAPARLSVTAQRVGGSWKIAEVESF